MISILNFFFHILAFGLLSTSIFGGLIIELKIRSEKDWNQKLFVTKLYNKFNLVFIIATIILLLTGILNMMNIYGTQVDIFKIEGWLMAKIILFAFFIINGILLGPMLVRKRTKSILQLIDKKAVEINEHNIRVFGKSIITFYLIQLILFTILVLLSVIGSGYISKGTVT